MADNHDIALMAHLLRRAGFGEQHAQLQERAATGYEATVEELLHPEDHDNGSGNRPSRALLHRVEPFHAGHTRIPHVPHDQYP